MASRRNTALDQQASQQVSLASGGGGGGQSDPVSYTHLRAHETVLDLVCRLLLEKKKKTQNKQLT